MFRETRTVKDPFLEMMWALTIRHYIFVACHSLGEKVCSEVSQPQCGDIIKYYLELFHPQISEETKGNCSFLAAAQHQP